MGLLIRAKNRLRETLVVGGALLCCLNLAGLSARAEDMSPLGRMMHSMDADLDALTDPGLFGGDGSVQEAAKDFMQTTDTLRDKRQTFAPYSPNIIGSRPKQVELFGALFDDISDHLKRYLAAVGDQAITDYSGLADAKVAVLQGILADIQNVMTKAHQSFIPARPLVRKIPPPAGWDDIRPLRQKDLPGKSLGGGDDPGAAHSVIWNSDRYKPGVAAAMAGAETADVVVIGGGVAGLVTAHELRDLHTVILEKDSQLGGNAKGAVWNGVPYSHGPAFMDDYEPGSPIANLLRDVGIDKQMRAKDNRTDQVEIDGVLYPKNPGEPGIWDTGTTPTNKAQFNLLRDFFEEMAGGKNKERQLPRLPAPTQEHRQYVEALNRTTFKEFLVKEVLGGQALDPDAEAVLDRYCWSSLGGTIDEIPAERGLNFWVGDWGKLLVAPGGNAGITDAIGRNIADAFAQKTPAQPLQDIRTSSVVFDLRKAADNDDVFVSYLDRNNGPHTIRAKAVVFGAPKFVAPYLIEGLEPERKAAIETLNYRSYLTASVRITGKLDPSFYDKFIIRRGDKPVPGTIPGSTDVVFGNYALADSANTVLTLYRPIPLNKMRRPLLEATEESLQADFKKEILEKILPSQKGLTDDQIKSIVVGVSKYGHPIPVGAKGDLAGYGAAKSKFDLLSKRFGNVFFANQDNWALPSFESAAESGFAGAAEVRKIVQPSAASASAAPCVAAGVNPPAAQALKRR